MHNRKKTVPLNEFETSVLKKKCESYKSLVDNIFLRRLNNDNSRQTLDAVAKMLRNNPDFYTLWNMRREIILATIPSMSKSECDLVQHEELQLSADGILRNPKSCKLV